MLLKGIKNKKMIYKKIRNVAMFALIAASTVAGAVAFNGKTNNNNSNSPQVVNKVKNVEGQGWWVHSRTVRPRAWDLYLSHDMVQVLKNELHWTGPQTQAQVDWVGKTLLAKATTQEEINFIGDFKVYINPFAGTGSHANWVNFLTKDSKNIYGVEYWQGWGWGEGINTNPNNEPWND